MYDWIFFNHATDGPPAPVIDLAHDLGNRLPSLATTETATGGLHRVDLLGAVGPVARAHSLGVPDRETFAATEVDLVERLTGVAVSVQTGRARTNNAALLAALAAASMPDIRWLILLVPERYKGTTTGKPVRGDLARLAQSTGVHLELDGVLLLTF